ncbi:alpha/beta hydrolase family protein [Lacticaseibacillus zhaodongensis]|uniref:alpha/beta hydrolase family protein n=1 Tax=Lacticaseibacillus zhaodongensis TaxID=2668065 RepID=UPI0018AF9C4A|nr:S9 family peptidase [Lacticaseibacillus zhaodongensis]
MQAIKATDIFQIKTLSKPQAAGDTVFYVENRIDQDQNAYLSAIYAYARGKRRRLRFGTNGDHDNNPQVSPNQHLLAFTAPDAAGKTQIYMQPVTGGSAQQFTSSPYGINTYAWRADGNVLYYVEAQRPERHPNRDATRITRLNYHSNGRGILPENGQYVLQRQELKRKTPLEVYRQSEEFALDAVDHQDHYVALSMAAADPEVSGIASQNLLVDVRTGAVTTIATQAPRGDFKAAAFSPDGSQLLMVGSTQATAVDLSQHLYTYNLASGSFSSAQTDQNLEIGDELAADTQQNLSGRTAAFGPSGEYFAISCQKGAVGLYQGPELAPLLTGMRHITDFSIQPDGSGIYFTVSSPTVPSQLAYYSFERGLESTLYDPNRTYSRNHRIVAPQEFSYKRGTMTIQGWYYAPTQSGKHAATLYIHGGPHAAYGYTFFHELQVQASRGYGVIAVNPRGSASYGPDFKAAVLQDYGGEDYQDLMAGVDAAMKLDPDIDPERLYCTGGSYGGFMSNWVETHTDRFRAVVTARSISNWVSFFGTSDIGHTFTPREMQANFQGDLSDPATLWKYSPLAYVDQAVTPILIMHGEEDLRCPISQGEEFYVGLKKHGVTCEFLRFPHSNHELSRSGDPRLRVQRIQAIIDWFARF